MLLLQFCICLRSLFFFTYLFMIFLFIFLSLFSLSSGHYMYASLSNRLTDSRGAIMSGFYPPTDGTCVRFFVAPVGDLDAGSLRIKQRSPSGIETELAMFPAGRLHHWHIGEVTLYSNIPDEVKMDSVKSIIVRFSAAMFHEITIQ